MRIQQMHSAFIMPNKGSEYSGAFDIYMPEAGSASSVSRLYPLGFAAEVPLGHVALLLPRSSAGSKKGIELTNTCGVIDSDYRGEWMAAIKIKDGFFYTEWQAGERLLQFLIVPVAKVELELVDSLESTDRGAGGFGSSGT